MDEQTMAQEAEWQPTLASLFDCWQSFLTPLHLADVAPRILEAVAQVTRSSRASLMLLDEEEKVLAIKVAMGLPQEVVANTRVRLGEGIAGWVAQNRCPLMLPDGPNVPASAQEALVREDITSALCVPLEAEGAVLGVLNLAREGDAPPFTVGELWFASVVAERVTLALENGRLRSQLEGRERFISRLVDSIPSSLLVIDHNLRVVSANRSFLRKTRRRARATLGRKIEEVFPRVLVESTQLDRKVRDVFRTGRSARGAKVAYRAPGVPTRIYYYQLISLKGEAGVENVMLLMDDITEREQLGQDVRRAERHLASIVECANDIVVSMDPRGRILTWNQAAERVSGLSTEQVQGQSLVSLCAAEDPPVMAGMLRRVARGERVENVEANLNTVDGHQVPVAWSCSSVQDDAGAVAGIVAVGRDLTERRQLEAQLITSGKLTSLGVMAGGIAHEIRNPLAISSAAAQLLLERPDDQKLRREAAERIRSGIQRASYIIENLLKFARPPQERVAPVDINEALEETLSLLVNQLRLRQVEVRMHFTPGLPMVVGNHSLLQQVFSNIILNASNAMPYGGNLTVTTRAGIDNQVEIEFADTGRGIPKEILDEIFDPFFTTMPVGKGTGLGLSISYSIIRQHHGAIDVKSKVGVGSTFTIRLPMERDRKENAVG